jgi:DNA repair exonuclease SbcCD ATPase subunit
MIKTIREVEAFISESVSKNDEDGESPKKRKGMFSGIAIIATLLYFLDFHTWAFERIMVTIAPPPREEEISEPASEQWSTYLEERISKSLDRIYELEALLTESRDQLRYSEEEREKLEAKIEELQNELGELRRAYEAQSADKGNSGTTLYERLNSNEDT